MPEEVQNRTWVRAFSTDDIPPGTCNCFSHEEINIAIFNADGEFHAIGDTCTHAEASLSEGEFFEDIRGWVVECPLHGSQFDVTTGDAVSLPATGNSGKYEVRVEDGVIYVNPEPVTPRRE